jgi:hypothetical protein
VSAKQDKTVQFLREVVGDDDAADRFEDMSLNEYADHKGIAITNRGEREMANGNGDPGAKADLLDEIDKSSRKIKTCKTHWMRLPISSRRRTMTTTSMMTAMKTELTAAQRRWRKEAVSDRALRYRANAHPAAGRKNRLFLWKSSRYADRPHRWRRSTQRACKFGLDLQICNAKMARVACIRPDNIDVYGIDAGL